MYEVEITTPKGILKFNLEKLEEIVLPKEYTEVRAKRLTINKPSKAPNSHVDEEKR